MQHEYWESGNVCHKNIECFNEMKKWFNKYQTKLYWQFDQSEIGNIIKITDELYKDPRNNYIMHPYMVLYFSISRHKGLNIDKNLEMYRYKIANPSATYEEFVEKFQLK